MREEHLALRIRIDALLAGPLAGSVAARDPHAVAALHDAVGELERAHEELLAQLEDLARAEALARSERRRYQELFAAAPQPYLVTDLGGVIQLANERAGALLGHPPSWLAGCALTEAIDDPDRPRVAAALAAPGRRQCEAVRFRLRPRRAAPVQVRATLSTARDLHGNTTVRWLLFPE